MRSTERSGFALAILAALAAGACVALQGRVNADLASAGAGVLAASWYSYLGTLLALLIAAAVTGRLPKIWRIVRTQSRWWWYAIGCCGAPIVIAMVTGVPLVGVALAGVCSLAGQTVSGMVFDARGIGVPAPIRFTWRRVVGALAAIGGLATVLLAAPVPRGVSAAVLVLAALGLFAGGLILQGQQAGNGAVMGVARDAMVPTLTSVLGGFALMSIVTGGAWGMGGLGTVHWPGADQWWLYLGGPLGTLITALSAVAVRHVGALVLTFVVVGGQMATAVVLDIMTGTGASWATAVAIAAIAVAVVLAASQPRAPALATRGDRP